MHNKQETLDRYRELLEKVLLTAPKSKKDTNIFLAGFIEALLLTLQVSKHERDELYLEYVG